MSNRIVSIASSSRSVGNEKMIRIDVRLTADSLSLSQRLAIQLIILFGIIASSSSNHNTESITTTFATPTTVTTELPLSVSTATATVEAATATTTTAAPVSDRKCRQEAFLQQQQALQEQRQLHMDVVEQPCEDFYEYACGNWRVGYQLRMLKATDTLTAIKATNQQQLIRYFETIDHEIENQSGKTAKSRTPQSYLHRAGDKQINKKKDFDQDMDMDNAIIEHIDQMERSVVNFYKSCLDNRIGQSKQRKAESLQFFINTLKSFAGDWSILQTKFPSNSSTKTNTTFNWEYLTAKMRRYGVQAVLRVLIQANWQSSKQLVFYLLPPTFDLLKLRSSDGHFDEELLFLYQRYIKYLFLDLGVPVRKAIRMADEVVDFEQQLFNLSKNQSQSIILQAPQTLQSVITRLPSMDLRKYFITLFEEFKLPERWSTKFLIVTDMNYLVKLSELLQLTSTDLLSKYLLVQFLAHFEFNLHDDESFTKQQQDCLMLVNEFLPQELSLVFLHLNHRNGREFLHQAQQHVNELFRKLKAQFRLMLNSSEVFARDPSSRQLSMEKLKSMRLIVPQISALDMKPLNFQIHPDKYESNLVNLWLLKTERDLSTYLDQLLELHPSIKTYMPSNYGPLHVNAYYRLRQNAIELPIGILQPPLYDPCLPAAQLYGGFGYILAHELIHGFDYDGLNYDHTGNLSDGWGVKAIIKFGVRSRCYLQQRYANGLLNVNENIADTEGLRLSLETFLHTLDDEAAIETNSMKEFFLSFAQTWCGSNSLTSAIPQHAAHKERVNNVLSNFMEFIDVYKCKATALLHAEEKCRIW